MPNLAKALYDHLVADTVLVAKLAVYPKGSSVPAIFTGDPVPGDAVGPFLRFAGNLSDEDIDTKSEEMRDVQVQIGAYCEADGSGKLIDEIGEAVRARCHDTGVVIQSWGTVLTRARGPVTAPSDGTVQGRIVTVLFKLSAAV